jgi:hypothetical protein
MPKTLVPDGNESPNNKEHDQPATSTDGFLSQPWKPIVTALGGLIGIGLIAVAVYFCVRGRSTSPSKSPKGANLGLPNPTKNVSSKPKKKGTGAGKKGSTKSQQPQPGPQQPNPQGGLQQQNPQGDLQQQNPQIGSQHPIPQSTGGANPQSPLQQLGHQIGGGSEDSDSDPPASPAPVLDSSKAASQPAFDCNAASNLLDRLKLLNLHSFDEKYSSLITADFGPEQSANFDQMTLLYVKFADKIDSTDPFLLLYFNNNELRARGVVSGESYMNPQKYRNDKNNSGWKLVTLDANFLNAYSDKTNAINGWVGQLLNHVVLRKISKVQLNLLV